MNTVKQWGDGWLVKKLSFHAFKGLASPNKLDLRKTSSRSELDSDELKPILSGGEVPEGTSTTEKLVLAGRNSSDEAGILRKSSKRSLIVLHTSKNSK